MRLRGLALVLGFCCVFHAQAADNAGSDIRAGREALGAGQPAEAKARFEAALADPEVRPDDRYAALVGLGRAEIWLGDYRAAREGFEKARELAQSDSDREAAATGLAQALNALDYPRQAYVLVAPYARDKPEASLEALKAQRALDWQDQSPAYLEAVPAINPQSRLSAEFRRIQADTDYALARRVEGGFDYQHDSDGLTLSGFSAGVSLPNNANTQFARWGFPPKPGVSMMVSSPNVSLAWMRTTPPAWARTTASICVWEQERATAGILPRAGWAGDTGPMIFLELRHQRSAPPY